MRWPSDQDYNEAIQNPQVAFSDAELKCGRIEVTPLGLPRARAGNFATVYRIDCGSKPYAVRCFRAHNPSQRDRYAAITTHLRSHRLPYTANFEFLGDGIRVGGAWYPILKMEWIEGENLISYVERHLTQANRLVQLAATWNRMLTDLRQAGIAHGDLQHGNVLVVNGDLRLVDYDGMFVPALKGKPDIELGHRNYQHPERTDFDFGPYLDNFAGWVIYISLLALSIQPSLWRQLNGGDECLLLRREDFSDPERSAAFQQLKGLKDVHIRTLAERLESFLWLPLDQIPVIDDGAGPRSTPVPQQPVSSWIQDYVGAKAAPAPISGAAELDEREPTGDSSWIHEHVEAGEPAPPLVFQNSPWAERLAFLCTLFIAGLLQWWAALFGVTALGYSALWLCSIALNILFWRLRYLREPGHAELKRLASSATENGRALIAAEQRLQNAKSGRQQYRASHLAALGRLNQQQADVDAGESVEIRGIRDGIQAQLTKINDKRRTLLQNEAGELKTLSDGSASRVARLNAELGALPGREQAAVKTANDTVGNNLRSLELRLQDFRNRPAAELVALSDRERTSLKALDDTVGRQVRSLEQRLEELRQKRATDLARALREYQDEIVNGHLHRFRIQDASIPGIGSELKRRLALKGVVSAADVGTHWDRVPGVGSKRWEALLEWRQEVEGPIRARQAPKALPPHRAYSIEQRYGDPIAALEQQVASERLRLTAAVQNTRKKFSDDRARLEEQKRRCEAEIPIIEQQIARERSRVASALEAIRRQFSDERSRIGREIQAEQSAVQSQSEAIRSRYSISRQELDREEAKVRSDEARAIQSCGLRHAESRARLQGQIDSLNGQYKSNLGMINKEVEVASKETRRCSWQRDRIKRQLAHAGNLSFLRYVRRLVLS